MTLLDEIRLIVKGINALKCQRDEILSNFTNADPYSTLEKIFDITTRYDMMVCCLIHTVWKLEDDRQSPTETNNS